MSKKKQLSQAKWRKVQAPKVWRPKPGEQLTGYYAGRTKRDGFYGQYDVVVIAVPFKGSFVCSGTELIKLCDAAMLTRGDAVRVTFVEQKEPSRGHQHGVKIYELEIGEFEEEDDTLPKVDQEVPPS